jgi:dTDP-4-dehydrorhamnose reductase
VTRVLVTGASGMLGQQIFNKLVDKKKYQVFTVGRKSLKISDNHFKSDIGEHDQLMQVLKTCEPEVVINCAAYTNLDYCEKNHTETDFLHRHAISVISLFPSVQSLYYISTDSVFDGQKADYSETDDTNPLNYYAQSKLNGEKEALKNAKNAYVIRTNIVGFGSKEGKSLFEWAYKNLSLGNRINGFSNVYFNPLYTGDLAEMLITFMEINNKPGIYNFASHPAISKYEFLDKLTKAMGFKPDMITPVYLDNSQINTMRPLNTTLNTNKISNLGISIPNIDICIKNLVNDFLKNGTGI